VNHSRPDHTPRKPTGLGRRARRIAPLAAAAGLACLFGGTGCQEEVTVLRYDPFLSHLPNATGGEPPVGTRPEAKPAAEGPADDLEVRGPDGKPRLVLRTIRHLMANIARAMDRDEYDLITEQALSRSAAEHFTQQGQDPRKAMAAMLAENKSDIVALFNRMPAGEQSATVSVSKPAPQQLRIELIGTAARGMTFTTLWAEMERGQWKLVWIN
jgi:hypothetical protein